MSKAPIFIQLILNLFPKRQHKQVCQIITFFVTLISYMAFHVARKPWSVVKPVLHQNCSGIFNTIDNIKPVSDLNLTPIDQSTLVDCSWKPFDGEDWTQLLGTLDVVYMLSYACGHYICGFMAERLNLRHFLLIGSMGVAITTSLSGMAYFWNIHTIYYFIIVQIFSGLCQASGSPCVVTSMGNWFGKKKRGRIMGFWNSHTGIGNILGALIPAALIKFGWGYAFLGSGGIMAIVGILVWFLHIPYQSDLLYQPQKKGEKKSLIPTEDEPKQQPITVLKALRIPGVVEFALSLFFAKFVVYSFLFWLPTYIAFSGSFSVEASANLSTFQDLGGLLGVIALGFVMDRFKISALPCVIFFLTAVPMLYVYFIWGSLYVINSIFLLMLIGVLVSGPYTLISSTVAADLGQHKSLLNNKSGVAMVCGIVDGTGSIGAAIGPLFTGLLVPSGWANVFYGLMVASGLAALLLVRCCFREIRQLCNKESDDENDSLSMPVVKSNLVFRTYNATNSTA